MTESKSNEHGNTDDIVETTRLQRITVVTPPDDVLTTAKRVLLVNLQSEQSSMISQAVMHSERQDPLIVYVWQSGSDVEWLLDKKLKSELVFFDAQHPDQLTCGFLAADPRAHYFGPLFGYSVANPNQIIDFEYLKSIV